MANKKIKRSRAPAKAPEESRLFVIRNIVTANDLEADDNGLSLPQDIDSMIAPGPSNMDEDIFYSQETKKFHVHREVVANPASGFYFSRREASEILREINLDALPGSWLEKATISPATAHFQKSFEFQKDDKGILRFYSVVVNPSAPGANVVTRKDAIKGMKTLLTRKIATAKSDIKDWKKLGTQLQKRLKEARKERQQFNAKW